MLTAGKRTFYALLGTVVVLLGLLGVFLPGIPTVPFILVALWAFSRSSNRLHSWLRNMPLLRQVHEEIDQFEKDRSLSLRVKIISQVGAWGSCIASFMLLRNIWPSAVLAVLAIACTIVMLNMRTRARYAEEDA